MTNIDLVQLELLLGESREAAPGEWRADYTGQSIVPGALLLSETDDESNPIWIAAHNTALWMKHAKAIAALRNAAPELIRLARIGQFLLEDDVGIRLVNEIQRRRRLDAFCDCGAKAVRSRARAALAKGGA